MPSVICANRIERWTIQPGQTFILSFDPLESQYKLHLNGRMILCNLERAPLVRTIAMNMEGI